MAGCGCCGAHKETRQLVATGFGEGGCGGGCGALCASLYGALAWPDLPIETQRQTRLRLRRNHASTG